MSDQLRMQILSNEPEDSSGQLSNLRMQILPDDSQESEGTALIKAPFRVGSDLLTSMYNAYHSLPEKYQFIKNELPNVPNAIEQHPLSALKQFGGGLAEAGGQVIKLPDAIQNYLSNRLHLMNKSSPLDYSKNNISDRMGELLQEINPHKELPNGEDVIQQELAKSIQNYIGDPKYPGEGLIRSAGKNILNIIGGAGIASNFNPLKLSSKNIANGLVETEKQMKQKYAGLYSDNANEAANRGITGDQINPDESDLKILENLLPQGEYSAIDKLMNDKNIPNAQNAISNLGFRQRVLNNKARREILNNDEKQLLNAVNNVKDHIQQNMFKDNNGIIHQDLADEHNNIQKGYANEVIPYTKNVALQEYKSGDRLASSLVNKLSNENTKFAARRGSYHPELGLRRFAKQHPYLTLTGTVASPIYLASKLYNYLNSDNGNQ